MIQDLVQTVHTRPRKLQVSTNDYHSKKNSDDIKGPEDLKT